MYVSIETYEMDSSIENLDLHPANVINFDRQNAEHGKNPGPVGGPVSGLLCRFWNINVHV